VGCTESECLKVRESMKEVVENVVAVNPISSQDENSMKPHKK
jgi:hypothetical protein